jgi:hypothetical protein
VAVVGTGLTAGYVIWLVRGGLLLTSLLTQMPAWRIVDPLVVLQYGAAPKRDEELEEEQDESLASLLTPTADPQPLWVETRP